MSDDDDDYYDEDDYFYIDDGPVAEAVKSPSFPCNIMHLIMANR